MKVIVFAFALLLAGAQANEGASISIKAGEASSASFSITKPSLPVNIPKPSLPTIDKPEMPSISTVKAGSSVNVTGIVSEHEQKKAGFFKTVSDTVSKFFSGKGKNVEKPAAEAKPATESSTKLTIALPTISKPAAASAPVDLNAIKKEHTDAISGVISTVQAHKASTVASVQKAVSAAEEAKQKAIATATSTVTAAAAAKPALPSVSVNVKAAEDANKKVDTIKGVISAVQAQKAGAVAAVQKAVSNVVDDKQKSVESATSTISAAVADKKKAVESVAASITAAIADKPAMPSVNMEVKAAADAKPTASIDVNTKVGGRKML